MQGIVFERLVLSFLILWRLKMTFCLAVDTGFPLEFGNLNFTKVSSACFTLDKGRCCRFVNAIVAISMSRYTNLTGDLAVPSSSFEICLNKISDTLQSNVISPNEMAFCGLGTKITTNFHCKGRTNVEEMEGTPSFREVQLSYVQLLSSSDSCRECLNARFTFLHNLEGVEDNVTLSICRDATFVTIDAFLGEYPEVEDSWLEILATQGPSLLADDISSSNVTDSGLSILQDCLNLQYLNLNYCEQISDAGLEYLIGLANFTSLSFKTSNAITAQGLRALAGLVNLTSLDLERCSGIHGGMVHIRCITCGRFLGHSLTACALFIDVF